MEGANHASEVAVVGKLEARQEGFFWPRGFVARKNCARLARAGICMVG
jgi:hypothetical protein